MTTESGVQPQDGPSDVKWVGQFHRTSLRTEYTVPDGAANYPDLRGRTGVCIGYRESANGRSWAHLEFKGETAQRHWVQTSHILPADGSEIVHLPGAKLLPQRIDKKDDSDPLRPHAPFVDDPVNVKFARIWE